MQRLLLFVHDNSLFESHTANSTNNNPSSELTRFSGVMAAPPLPRAAPSSGSVGLCLSGNTESSETATGSAMALPSPLMSSLPRKLRVALTPGANQRERWGLPLRSSRQVMRLMESWLMMWCLIMQSIMQLLLPIIQLNMQLLYGLALILTGLFTLLPNRVMGQIFFGG